MTSTIRQIAPCRFTVDDYSLEPITYNLTKHFEHIIENEVWNRAYDYGFSANLKSIQPEEFKNITVTIYPKLVSGPADPNRPLKAIIERCGQIEESFLNKCTSEFDEHLGLIIIELELNRDVKEMIQTDEDFKSDFIIEYNVFNEVLKEVSAFLLAGLNLLFPTNSWYMDAGESVRDGFIQIQSQGKEYLNKHKTGKFTHQILIEKNEFDSLEVLFSLLAKTWHKNLWPIRRYLIAVESSNITMDNLLDLIYALEGMFKDNTSSDFIKLMVCVQFSETKEQAIEMKSFLDTAFRIRNAMVHGGKTFDQIDKAKINGKEVLASEIYWEMKRIVAAMIVRALPKLIKQKEQMSICYNPGDMWDKIYNTKKV